MQVTFEVLIFECMTTLHRNALLKKIQRQEEEISSRFVCLSPTVKAWNCNYSMDKTNLLPNEELHIQEHFRVAWNSNYQVSQIFSSFNKEKKSAFHAFESLLALHFCGHFRGIQIHLHFGWPQIKSSILSTKTKLLELKKAIWEWTYKGFSTANK